MINRVMCTEHCTSVFPNTVAQLGTATMEWETEDDDKHNKRVNMDRGKMKA